MSSKDADLLKIKELIKIMKENDLVEVEIRHDDDKIFLKRAQPQAGSGGTITAVPVIAGTHGAMSMASASQGVPAATGEAAAARQDEGLLEVKSPMVGTFYEGPSPDSEPYVEVGVSIDSQTVVCIIEAMKVMNEIKAEVSGTVVKVLAKNGQAVEYGQPLFKVRPD